MSYYKLIVDGQIIDAVEDPVWVKQSKNGVIMRCDIKEAMGVVSSDMTSIYHIAGTANFTGTAYDEISMADITADEYEELKTLLDLGANVDDNSDVEWPTEDPIEEELPADATLDEVKKRKIAALSSECQQIIYYGVDVELSDGDIQHFALEVEDQLNLITLSQLIESGETQIPYHASDLLCTYYSAEDIGRIIMAATAYKTYHTSYFNSLKNWVMAMTTVAEVGAVSYGDVIPVEYRSEVLANLMGS